MIKSIVVGEVLEISFSTDLAINFIHQPQKPWLCNLRVGNHFCALLHRILNRMLNVKGRCAAAEIHIQDQKFRSVQKAEVLLNDDSFCSSTFSHK
jgi:hypothetical protein